MKYKKILIPIIFIASLFLYACPYSEPEWNESSETDYKPILMKREILEKSIGVIEGKEIVSPGKIYVKGNFLYIVEKYEGVHIIDNSDPANPAKKGFITVPGCIDIAVKQNIMYADNAVDLVAIELSENVSEIKETSRNKNVFPELVPPDAGWVSIDNRPENTVIIKWKK